MVFNKLKINFRVERNNEKKFNKDKKYKNLPLLFKFAIKFKKT